MAAQWARFEEGDLAHESLNVLLRKSTEDNLFDLHPPHIFQIDGNLGACAAVAEMLVQSHAGEISLLPALPRAWPNGYVRGLRARGGFEVEIVWRDGKVNGVLIRSSLGGTCKIRTKRVPLQAVDAKLRLARLGKNLLSFETQPGKAYQLMPL